MDKILEKNIIEEMEKSFIDYSMSVIIARALPDIRDGLKPVHRRILYGMNALGITPDKAFKKSARIVGDVVGKYHPHGDTAVYETMVRMVQDFAYRYPLVEGHGNFGSIDGYGAAAMRYTEARLSKIATELLRDINKDTVDFIDNYDGQEREPTILPSRFPNILVSGTMGIAVGMATNIPPHNLGEVIDGCVAYIDNDKITNMELMEYIKGPDFPTGAIILGNNGIKNAYETGKGSLLIRSKVEVLEQKNKKMLIIKEIPFQINKKILITRIAELVREKKLEGISNLTDETNLKGIKIVIELKKEANAEVVLNNLYKNTNLQTSYSINLLALSDGRPQLLTLREIIGKYLEYQREIIVRRSRFDLDKAEKRAHILEGLKKALDNIDAIIKIIKQAKSEEEALREIISKFLFTQPQAEAILEMKLRRLTGLEREKIENELKDLFKTIEYLKDLLQHDEKIMNVIKDEMLEIKEKYSDERRTEIDLDGENEIEDESLIPVTDSIITLTRNGYIKRVDEETYRTQKRGGIGVKGMNTHEEDFVEHVLSCQTHDYIFLFSNFGKVYRLKGYNIPHYSRQARGIPIINLIPLVENEMINTVLKVSPSEESQCLLFCTRNGLVKRSKIADFDLIRKTGKIAIKLRDDDELLAVRKTTGENEIFIAASNGRMVRFVENQIRIMGRTAAGVKGISFENAHCVGCEVHQPENKVLVITEKGYGKISAADEYRLTKRGAKGVKALNITSKNGSLASFKMIKGDEDLVVITDLGIVIRISVSQIPVLRRATQGVRVINLKDNQKVVSVATINNGEEDVPRETYEEEN